MKNRRDIVVVGASRGGLEALSQVLGSLPGDFPASPLVVLHTAPASPRLLAEILGQQTTLPVSYARDGDDIRRGHVYLAPPGCHLIVRSWGMLGLDAGPKVRHARPAADRLFQSAAEIYGARVIGVVLTGGDHDGTDGLRAIKSAGGISIIQHPGEAIDPSMPISALRGDSPDYCVSLDQMGPLIGALVRTG